METIRDQSYGVVPIIKVRDEWRVLLVHQISYRGPNDRFWTFPKGHPEEDESAVEAAKRELMEETSIEDVQILEEAAFTINYSFKHEGKKVDKSVTYYLGICTDDTVTVTLPNEIAEVSWFSFKDAMEKLTHKNAQQVLVEAGQYINSHIDLL